MNDVSPKFENDLYLERNWLNQIKPAKFSHKKCLQIEMDA